MSLCRLSTIISRTFSSCKSDTVPIKHTPKMPSHIPGTHGSTSLFYFNLTFTHNPHLLVTTISLFLNNEFFKRTPHGLNNQPIDICDPDFLSNPPWRSHPSGRGRHGEHCPGLSEHHPRPHGHVATTTSSACPGPASSGPRELFPRRSRCLTSPTSLGKGPGSSSCSSKVVTTHLLLLRRRGRWLSPWRCSDSAQEQGGDWRSPHASFLILTTASDA